MTDKAICKECDITFYVKNIRYCKTGKCSNCNYKNKQKRKNKARKERYRNDLIYRDKIRRGAKEYYEKNFDRMSRMKKEYYKTHPIQTRISHIIHHMKHECHKRGYEFDKRLTREVIESFITYSDICEWCGVKFVLKAYNNNLESAKSPSIDKIDYRKGYNLDNIQCMCWGCNRLKNKMTNKEFIELLRERGELYEGF